jgi:inhibitor of cysteine peptidase
MTVPLPAQTGNVTSGAASAHSVAIDSDSNGKTITMQVGDEVIVSLPVNGGTGYTWQLSPLTTDTLLIEFPPAAMPSPKHWPGAPAYEASRLRVRRAGAVTLQFSLVRPWEDSSPPAQTFSITLSAK